MRIQHLGESNGINLSSLLIFSPRSILLPALQDDFQSGEHMAHSLQKCSAGTVLPEIRPQPHLGVNPSAKSRSKGSARDVSSLAMSYHQHTGCSACPALKRETSIPSYQSKQKETAEAQHGELGSVGIICIVTAA